jgi:hypothetical protein
LIVATTIFERHAASDKKANLGSTPTYHGVDVVDSHGGIPDTTNAINLTHNLDTIGNCKDSSK